MRAGSYVSPLPDEGEVLLRRRVFEKLVGHLIRSPAFQGLRHVADVFKDELLDFMAEAFYLHYLPGTRVVPGADGWPRGVLRRFLLSYANSRAFRRLKVLTIGNEDLSYLVTIALVQGMLELARAAEAAARAGSIDPSVQRRLARAYQSAIRQGAMLTDRLLRNVSLFRAWGLEPSGLRFMAELMLLDVRFVESVLLMAEKIWRRLASDGSSGGAWFSGNAFKDYVQLRNPARASYLEYGQSLILGELWLVKAITGWRIARREWRVRRTLIILADKSGSMFGDATVWCRSIAVALLREAWRRKWRSYVALFDATVSEFRSDRKEQLKALLTVSPGGGTDIQGAIFSAVSFSQREGIDSPLIVVITDEIAPVSAERVAEAKRSVRAKLAIISVRGSENEELRRAADAVFIAGRRNYLGPELALEAVKSVRRLMR